jgi:CheY-like chemotaxis protein
MKIFILEDDSQRVVLFKKLLSGNNIIFAHKAQTAFEILKKDKVWDIIFLDHDLGGKQHVNSFEEETGYQVSLFIKKNGIKYNQLIVHSLNYVGAKNISCVLKDCEIIPFHQLIKIL